MYPQIVTKVVRGQDLTVWRHPYAVADTKQDIILQSEILWHKTQNDIMSLKMLLFPENVYESN